MLGGYAIAVDDNASIEYFDCSISCSKIEKSTDNTISMGAVTLSYIGESLMSIIIPVKVDGFFEEIVVPFFKRPEHYVERMFGNRDL